jgi:tRNA-specific adenosine deaminase 1
MKPSEIAEAVGSLSARHFMLDSKCSLHMFTTEAPCGDASMDLLIASKDNSDSIPWVTAVQNPGAQSPSVLPGRGYFSELGKVRRKPARSDAEATMSKSCTDKLAVKQVTGLFSFPADLLVKTTDNAYLKSLVVYSDQHHADGYARAFRDRLAPLSGMNVRTRPFDVKVLPNSFRRFPFEKVRGGTIALKPSNISALWIAGHGEASPPLVEVVMNGVREGFKPSDNRPAKESTVCRRRMFSLAAEIIENLKALEQKTACDENSSVGPVGAEARDSLLGLSYGEAKASPLRQPREDHKVAAMNVLKDWHRSVQDRGWTLSTPH